MSSMFKEIKFEQPPTFEFTKENLKKAHAIIMKYPKQQSAVMPLLWLAQQQHNSWVPRAAMIYIAELLDMPAMKVFEIAHFYTMYNKQPVGKNLIQVCRTTPCWLRGSDQLTETCRNKLGIDVGETTIDGAFTLVEVECLGACVNAPMVQINDDYFEDLTPNDMAAILDELAQGDQPKSGSYANRQCSAPSGYSKKNSTTKSAKAKVIALDFGDELNDKAPAKKRNKKS